MNFRTINDLNRLIKEKISIVPRAIDLVVGIPRSGMLPASLISLYMNVPLVDLFSLTNNSNREINQISARLGTKSGATRNISEYKKILVIDDSSNTGRSIQKARDYIEKLGCQTVQVIYACVFATDRTARMIDLYFEICNQPRMFEWNIMNHSNIMSSCFDMDGVLCVDPTSEQNDDGEKYIDFILNAKPLFVPTFKIGAIVTSRLEKYREYTEIWLKKNNVQYEHLLMLNLPDKESRILLGAHSVFKSNVYSKIENAMLFYESNPVQAKDINYRTNKPVYCVETNEFFDKDSSLENYFDTKNRCDEIEAKAYQIISTIDGLLQSVVDGNANLSYEQIVSVLKEVSGGLYSFFLQYKMTNDFVESLKGFIEFLESDNSEEDKLEQSLSFPFCEAYNNLYEYHMEIKRRYGLAVTDKAWRHELFILQKEIMDYLGTCTDSEYASEIEYIRSCGKLVQYPYPFTEIYKENEIEVYFDPGKNMKYVISGDKKLFFALSDDAAIRYRYNCLLLEQDSMSPMAFCEKCYELPEDYVLVDIGAEEGFVSLKLAENAKQIYLIDSDRTYQRSLTNTFEEYMFKTQILSVGIDERNTDTSITIDSLLDNLSGENVIIKIAANGMELNALYGAANTLANNRCFISCTSYHTDNQANDISEFFDMVEYNHSLSKGYVLPLNDSSTLKNGYYEHAKAPFFRRALVRAWR